MPSDLLTTTEAAAALGVKPQTMRKWRQTGAGPLYIRFGGPFGRAHYRRSDIDAWVDARVYANTSAETVARSKP